MIDWSDGIYERTASQLEPVSSLVVERAGVGPSHTVLDLGCGTGNAAIAAARRGARVVGVDPASRLVAAARERAEAPAEANAHAHVDARKLDATFEVGDAQALRFDDASFDIVVSVFAVIFAPDAERAAREMVRVLRPSGRLVFTSWVHEGGIAEAGALLRQALTEASSAGGRAESGAPSAPTLSPPWGDPERVRRLFAPLGVELTDETETLVFTAGSAEAWWEDQAENHPAWRAGRRMLDAAAWDALRARSIERLSAWSEDPNALRLSSRYLVFSGLRG